MALVSVVLDLRIGLSVARIQEQLRATTGWGRVPRRGRLIVRRSAARLLISPPIVGPAIWRGAVAAGRRRIGHDVAGVGGAPGVIEVVPVVIRHTAPPVGHIT